ncbi:Alpha-amylase 2B [Holothuria leucospilota]|uniref:Alpha-amylase n=1 Tax=Holothuria leucospilota TaxID=206669 RepID=A0A9Q1HDM0_HOLLE|nr:Alpha-amylase 2B [Holothuria leucospilota]
MQTFMILFILGVANGQFDTNAVGDRETIVQLFSWKWTDVALECERFLGPNGYGGVQVSPPNDHTIMNDPFRPWWERYQVAGYNLVSRSGDENEFADMVERCNQANVRIYVDAVINHMAFFGGDSASGEPFNPDKLDYPTVPYTEEDFSVYYGLCNTTNQDILNQSSVKELRDCNLLALKDLAQHEERVRSNVAAYLNKMIDIGVAGFRLDAAKHMWPDDLENIYGRLNELKADHFEEGSKALLYHEVIDKGQDPIRATEYTHLGRVTEFNYGPLIVDCIRRHTPLKDFGRFNFAESWELLPSGEAVSFIDNHDNQRGEGQEEIVNFKEPKEYKMANALMLAWPYGINRVMSSYEFETSDDGPPSNEDGDLLSPEIDEDGLCTGGWVCEHRWRVIKNMVKYQNVVRKESVTNWWDNGNQQVAFGRGKKGFFVMNNELEQNLTETIMTGLPQGEYCNVILGEMTDGECSGPTVQVNSEGYADFTIAFDSEEPMVAIHVDALVAGTGNVHVASFVVILLAFLLSLSFI